MFYNITTYFSTQAMQELYVCEDSICKTAETLCNMQPKGTKMRVWSDGALYDKNQSWRISSKTFYDRSYTVECLESFAVEAEKRLDGAMSSEQKETMIFALFKMHAYLNDSERKEEFSEAYVQNKSWNLLSNQPSFDPEKIQERIKVLADKCQTIMSDHTDILLQVFMNRDLYQECKQVVEMIIAKDQGFDSSLIKDLLETCIEKDEAAERQRAVEKLIPKDQDLDSAMIKKVSRYLSK